MNDITNSFKILIVDDEKTNLDILNYILKPNHMIYIAKTGGAAIKRAEADNPDLILLDVILPDMTGFEVLTTLKQSEKTCSIPIIIITGLDSVKDEEKGFFLGAVDYIKKPFHSSIVKARVETHLKIIKQMRIIERLGLIDVLTDLPNKRSFENQINTEWGKAMYKNTSLSLLMLDIDKFKNYNDQYGHQQGDVMLRAIAKVISKAVSHVTDLVFRWGGEEFAVLLPNINLDMALSIAEVIRTDIEAARIPCMNTKELTKGTTSIGVSSCIPYIGNAIPDLILQADQALYEAKNTGRNKVCFKYIQ